MSKRIKIERSCSKWYGIELQSGDDEYRGCRLVVLLPTLYMSIHLPTILAPHREQVVAKYWDAETIARMGRDWYWSVTERVYGFCLMDGHIDLKFGRQSMDSRTEQRWGCFLPWTQWRFSRHSLYDLLGDHVVSVGDKKDIREWMAMKEAAPKRLFTFRDFDGEEITATTMIEEREWKFGTGWFRWLSLFRGNRVRRSLNLEFSGEVGPRKGSWKGGTVGHSIEMMCGELHESAFRRYCHKEGLTFVAAA